MRTRGQTMARMRRRNSLDDQNGGKGVPMVETASTQPNFVRCRALALILVTPLKQLTRLQRKIYEKIDDC